MWLNDNEIICNVGLGCENESTDQGRSYVDKNINISNCFFKRYLEYSGDGGVIYVSASSYSMNINYSMFYNCVCSYYGGALCFYSSNSCLRMICVNSCSCGAFYDGHFDNLNKLTDLLIVRMGVTFIFSPLNKIKKKLFSIKKRNLPLFWTWTRQ